MALAGRPTIYDSKQIHEICSRLALGESLREICSDPAMPSRETVRKWLASNRPEHAELLSKYAHAREQQGDDMDDRVLEVANGVVRGEIDPHAARVAIAAFQWRASKLRPDKYGDRVITAGDASAPVEHRLTVVYEDKPAKMLDKGGEPR